MFRRFCFAVVMAACLIAGGVARADSECAIDAAMVVYPAPKKACLNPATEMPKAFRLRVVNKTATADVQKRLSAILLKAGIKIVNAPGEASAEIVLDKTSVRHKTVFRQEGYSLDVTPGAPFVIRIGAITHPGFLYALQTLEQLIVAKDGRPTIYPADIQDYPSFSLRGVLEGGYDVWGHAQRTDVLRWMGDYKMNYFIYAPKDGMYFRRLWRVPFPEKDLKQFKEAIEICNRNDIVFAFSLSPALSIEYSNPEEFKKLVAKYRQIQKLGVQDFGIFFDDVLPVLYTKRDKQKYGNVAAAEADITNRLLKALREKDPKARLFFVPNEYWGITPTNYLTTLKETLSPEIPVGWTGVGIVSDTIPTKDAVDFGKTIGRKPSIGDNWSPLGPLVDRAPDLNTAADSFVNNPYNYAGDDNSQLSKFVNSTVGDYGWNSEAYEPDRSMRMGCRRIAGDAERGDLLLSVITRGKKGALFDANRILKDVSANLRDKRDPNNTLDALNAARMELAALDARAEKLGPSLPGLKMPEQMAGLIADFRKRVADETALIELALSATGDREEIASKIEKLPGVKQ